MKRFVHLLALVAAVLMAMGSVCLRFVKQDQVWFVVATVVGVALAWFCVRTARDFGPFVQPSFVTRNWKVLLVIVGFLAFGLPEFLAERIEQWRGATLLLFLVADTLLGTASFFGFWLFARKQPSDGAQSDLESTGN